jgi:hypothetical protein
VAVFNNRRLAGCLSLVAFAILLAGCGQQAEAPGTVAQVNRPVSTKPGEIELSDPVVTLAESNTVRFEIKYRFIQGNPEKYYLCEISFPGTPNYGVKPMESWELKSQGVIKDTIVLFKPPVQTFEIRMSEADSPQNGYKIISNVVSGPVK